MVPEISTRLLQQAQAFSSAQYPSSRQYQQQQQQQQQQDHSSTPQQPQPQPQPTCQILLLGIESHICLLQTATDLLSLGHRVYVLADGVSSCNPGERGVALDRLRQEGCTVTTSESVIFEMVGDAARAEFKGGTAMTTTSGVGVAALVKEFKERTGVAVQRLCAGLYGIGNGDGGTRESEGEGAGKAGKGEGEGEGEGERDRKEVGGSSRL
jgi:Isochorismatase family